jgi:hypothetical protein
MSAGAPASICFASAEEAGVGHHGSLAAFARPGCGDLIERVLEARGREHHDVATLRLDRSWGQDEAGRGGCGNAQPIASRQSHWCS